MREPCLCFRCGRVGPPGPCRACGAEIPACSAEAAPIEPDDRARRLGCAAMLIPGALLTLTVPWWAAAQLGAQGGAPLALSVLYAAALSLLGLMSLVANLPWLLSRHWRIAASDGRRGAVWAWRRSSWDPIRYDRRALSLRFDGVDEGDPARAVDDPEPVIAAFERLCGPSRLRLLPAGDERVRAAAAGVLELLLDARRGELTGEVEEAVTIAPPPFRHRHVTELVLKRPSGPVDADALVREAMARARTAVPEPWQGDPLGPLHADEELLLRALLDAAGDAVQRGA